MRTFLSLLALFALAYLGLVAWIYATQRTQMYFPVPESRHPGAEVLWLENQAVRIKVWHLARPGGRALIYFGGNAEDVSGNVESFAHAFPGHSLFLVNYRGYGGSSGRPSEAGLVADALAVFDHVQQAHGEIAVMGRSLGSGVAVALGSKRPVDRLALVTPFDSLVNVAREHMGWLPVGLLMKDRYDSAGLAHGVEAPVLIVIAAEDEIISRPRSEALAAAFKAGQARSVIVQRTTHNTLDLSPQYLGVVQQFLRAQE